LSFVIGQSKYLTHIQESLPFWNFIRYLST